MAGLHEGEIEASLASRRIDEGHLTTIAVGLDDLQAHVVGSDTTQLVATRPAPTTLAQLRGIDAVKSQLEGTAPAIDPHRVAIPDVEHATESCGFGAEPRRCLAADKADGGKAAEQCSHAPPHRAAQLIVGSSSDANCSGSSGLASDR